MGVLICKNRIKNINQIQNKNVKDFNIKIENDLIAFVYNSNNSIFKKNIELYKIIHNHYEDLDKINYIKKDINLLNLYTENLINKNLYSFNCDCNLLFSSKLLNCIICEKCFCLYNLDHLDLGLGLVSDHFLAAEAKASL